MDLDETAIAATWAAAEVAAAQYGERVRQVVTIITVEAEGDVDDTAMATVGMPGAGTPEAVLDTLLGHVVQAAEKLGGEVRILGLGDIGKG